MSATSDIAAKPKSDRWIPWLFVWAFLVVAAVNTVFVTLAIKSNTGLVTEDPYEKGLAFNQTLDKAAAEAKLGWKFRYDVDATTQMARIHLTDANGVPLAGGHVTGRMIREVVAGHDYDVPFTEVAKGVYESELKAPLKGAWKLHVVAEKSGKSSESSETIVLK